MRKVQRIERITRLLGMLWNKNPDYRFGQLLINYNIIPDDLRVWNNEDDDFEEYLQERLKE